MERFLAFSPWAVVNYLATSCRDVVLVIEIVRQRIRSGGCSACDLVIYHGDAVEAVWCDEALSNDGSSPAEAGVLPVSLIRQKKERR
jgi:hypothetical protein